MIKRYFWFLILIFSVACSVKPAQVASEAKPAENAKIETKAQVENDVYANKIDGKTCKRGAETRSIWIEKIKPSGCKVWYSNHRKKGPAAWSVRGLGHCFGVRNGIVAKLEAASFKCTSN